MAASNAIYVAGLPPDATEQELAQYFGQAGTVKIDQQTGVPNVWIYKDAQTGASKGDAVVAYDDAYAAASAIQYLHQRPLRGSILHVNSAGPMELSGGVHAAPSAQTQPAVAYYDPSAQLYTQQAYTANQAAYPQSQPAVQEGWNGEQAAGAQKATETQRGRGKKITAAPQGPARLFGPDDWPCPSCGNTNWARRPRCNLCGAPKPGTLDMKREGQAGGFKELDEEALEEARRRRKALEEADDGELYDDYGRIKKKYRSVVDKETREQAALARLRGEYDPSPSGQELAFLLKKEGAPEEAAEGETEEKPASPAASEKEHETETANEKQRGRSRSPSEGRHYSRRDSRRRSPSPRYRSTGRRESSPRDRDAYRSRRPSYHRPRDREERHRHRR